MVTISFLLERSRIREVPEFSCCCTVQRTCSEQEFYTNYIRSITSNEVRPVELITNDPLLVSFATSVVSMAGISLSLNLSQFWCCVFCKKKFYTGSVLVVEL